MTKTTPAHMQTDTAGNLLASVRRDLGIEFDLIGQDLDCFQDLQALRGIMCRLHELINRIIRIEFAFQSGCHSDQRPDSKGPNLCQ
ncbi:MAG TPA: hypothetical protein VLE22_15560 [Bryobacteraceae bacterium]|nr:hypothetical protein [Bryobacteraceae bacterium]